MARIVNLDVNDSGSWRRVSSFDLDEADGDQLQQASDALLRQSNYRKLRARIVAAGETGALMHWTREQGWKVNAVAA